MEFGLGMKDVDVGDGLVAVNDGMDVGDLRMADDLVEIVQHVNRGFFVISPKEAAVAVAAAINAGGVEEVALGGVFNFVDEIGNVIVFLADVFEDGEPKEFIVPGIRNAGVCKYIVAPLVGHLKQVPVFVK